jgi:hypothetical protein
MAKKQTRATGTKTKKWFSGSVDKAAAKYANKHLMKNYPGGEAGFKKDASGSNPSKAGKAFRGAAFEGRVYRASNFMPNKSVTEVTYNKPEKKLQTGRDIPLPKSNF